MCSFSAIAWREEQLRYEWEGEKHGLDYEKWHYDSFLTLQYAVRCGISYSYRFIPIFCVCYKPCEHAILFTSDNVSD
jgi:hypothetical protein